MSSSHALLADDLGLDKATDVSERRHAGFYRFETWDDTSTHHVNHSQSKTTSHTVEDITAEEIAALNRGALSPKLVDSRASGLHGIRSTMATGVLFLLVLITSLALYDSSISRAVLIIPLSVSFLLFMLSAALEWKISDSSE